MEFGQSSKGRVSVVPRVMGREGVEGSCFWAARGAYGGTDLACCMRLF